MRRLLLCTLPAMVGIAPSAFATATQLPDSRPASAPVDSAGPGAGPTYADLVDLTLASPVVSVAAAAAILGEPVLAAQVIGIAIVVGSLGVVVARTTAHARRVPTEEEDPLPTPEL